MLVRVGLWWLRLGLLCLILAYEQSLSIPFLTIMVMIMVAQNQTRFGRQALVVTTGLVLATVYGLPLGLGILVMWSAAYGWKLAEFILKPDAPRLLLVSFSLALAVGFLSGIDWTGWGLFLAAINVVLSLLVIRFTAISTAKMNTENYD